MPVRKTTRGVSKDSDTSNAKESTPLKQYRGWGFGKPIRPDGVEPNCPTSFSDIPSNKLGDSMARFSAWREYAQNLYNQEFPDYTILKEKYDFEYNKTTIVRGGSKRLKEIKAEVESDEVLHKLKTELTEKEILIEMLSSKIETYAEVIASISREISRRSSLPDR
jgi:hypothetical protein